MSRVKTVVAAIQRLFPREWADSSWDNTGLLVDCAFGPEKAAKQTKVLLAIDLTRSVCEEAIKSQTDLIIAYHPFIFRGLKSISPNDPQQKSLLELIQNGISVYCPHTAVDAAAGGVNDWLVEGITANGANKLSSRAIEAVAGVPIEKGVGMGRIVELKEARKLSELIASVKKHLQLDTLQLALAPRHETDLIKRVAICAGSGSTVLRGSDVDLWLTGELGHHDALHLTQSGTSALICLHSNTERGYLSTMKRQLEAELGNEPVDISVSTTDHDPITYV